MGVGDAGYGGYHGAATVPNTGYAYRRPAAPAPAFNPGGFFPSHSAPSHAAPPAQRPFNPGGFFRPAQPSGAQQAQARQQAIHQALEHQAWQAFTSRLQGAVGAARAGNVQGALQATRGLQSVFGQRVGAPPFAAQRADLFGRMLGLIGREPAVAANNLTIDRQAATEDPAYRKMMAGLWGRLSGMGLYPSRRMPPTSIMAPVMHTAGPMQGMKGYGNYPWAGLTGGVGPKAQVLIAPATVHGAISSGDPYDKEVPIHEWAHAFQSPQVRASRPTAEGGAEAFKSLATSLLGMQATVAPGYGSWGHQQAQRGRGYLTRGQFGY